MLNGTAVCTVALAGGSAQCATTAPSSNGSYPVVVNYSGDATYAESSANATALVSGLFIFADGFED